MIIICPKNIISIAISIQKYLNKYKINSIIKEKLQKNDTSSKELYIIVHLNDYTYIPKRYIVYQIKNSISRFFKNKKYIDLLKNSLYIWEFSVANIYKYKDIVGSKKICYMNIPFFPYKIIKNIPYIYDIFFYGGMNDRRKKILETISKKYNILYGIFHGKTLEDNIQKSKIILNLHYYDEPKLESTRLNECLQYSKIIISEKSIKEDWYNMEIYKNIVSFVDIIHDNLDNIQQLYDTIDNILLHYDSKKDTIQKNIKEIRELRKKSLFHFSKCIYTLDTKYINNTYIDFEVQKKTIYCLHLLKSTNRLKEFTKQEYIPNYTLFPAISYNPGWIGCALSYKNLLYNAKKYNIPRITICEDYCKFMKNFDEKYKIIQSFLDICPHWDIFVGVMADLANDTIFYNMYSYKGVTFFEIDKMVSMVYNIYNHTSYETIINWKYSTNTNNTIDRYIQRSKLKNIITYPFYYSILDVVSTIWTNNSNIYNNYMKMINDTLEKIKKKYDSFQKNKIYIPDIVSIRYGISDAESIDVKDIILQIITRQNILYKDNFLIHDHIKDPYVNKPKKLIICTIHDTIIIPEYNNRLQDSIYFYT